MANNVTFEIFCQWIEDSLSVVYYSDTISFNLKKYENDKLVFDGEVSIVRIERGLTDIPMSDIDDVRHALYDYIDAHNENLASHSLDIRFEITGMDSRYAFVYKEYYNGKLIKEGTGWGKDFELPREREAWDEAVVEYKKNNGIEMSTDKMKSGMNDVNNSISKLDTQFTLEFDLIPPLIETAIPTLATDPCNFVNNIIKATKVAISRINGLPSPAELANYYIKLGKDNISSVTTAVANAQQEATGLSFSPVEDSFDDTYEYFRELDAEREEYLKTHSEDFYLFDVVDYEPPVLAEALQYNGSDETYTDENTGETYTGKTISGGNKSEVIRALGFTGTDSKSYCDSLMVTIKVQTMSGEKRLTVHRDLAAEIQSIFRDMYNAGFNVTFAGGYKYRHAQYPDGTDKPTLSMHSFGCALDINPSTNPYTASQKRPFEYAPVTWKGKNYNPSTCIWTNDHPVVKIFRNYEWGWGGRYGDFMHFSKANGS